jgi:hypothetical protein
MSKSDIFALVFASLYAVCEVLVKVPSIKANSFFELVSHILKNLAGKNNTPPPAA